MEEDGKRGQGVQPGDPRPSLWEEPHPALWGAGRTGGSLVVKTGRSSNAVAGRETELDLIP